MPRNSTIRDRRARHKAARSVRVGVRRADTGLSVLSNEVADVQATIPADLSEDFELLLARVEELEP